MPHQTNLRGPHARGQPQGDRRRLPRQPRDRHRQVRGLLAHRRGVAPRRGHPLGRRHRQPGAPVPRRARARRAADREHPFGYGRERYFWSFIVALVLFTLGGSVRAVRRRGEAPQPPRARVAGDRDRDPRGRDRPRGVLVPHGRARSGQGAGRRLVVAVHPAQQEPRAPRRAPRGHRRADRPRHGTGGRHPRRGDRRGALGRDREHRDRHPARGDRDHARDRDEEPADRRVGDTRDRRPPSGRR